MDCRFAAFCFPIANARCKKSAQYSLEIGDVIELSVAGFPELTTRTTVDMDGQVMLPLIGKVRASGSTIEALTADAQQQMGQRVLRRTSPDGRDFPAIVLPELVSISVAEFRPIYINGDVAKPGALKFLPGLTVRKAVALAGGYDLTGGRLKDPFLEHASLQSEYHTLWIELTKEEIRLKRIDAELANRNKFDNPEIVNSPVPQKVKSEIERLEAEHLVARIAQFNREKDIIEGGVKRTNAQIAFLTEVQKNDKEAMDINQKELERTTDLFNRGLAPIATLTEAQRNVLLQSTRQLEALGQRSMLEKNRDELSLMLEKTDGQRTIELLRERQDSEVAIAALRSRIKSVFERLSYTKGLKALSVQDEDAPPRIEIYRNGSQGPAIGEEETVLLPGDLVEITFPTEQLGNL